MKFNLRLYIFIQQKKKKKGVDIYLWMEETYSTGLIIGLEEIDLSIIFQSGKMQREVNISIQNTRILSYVVDNNVRK